MGSLLTQKVVLLRIEDHTVETWICFLGQKIDRTIVTFNASEKPHCKSFYPEYSIHYSGLLSVHYGCGLPKIIGFVVLTQTEYIPRAKHYHQIWERRDVSLLGVLNLRSADSCPRKDRKPIGNYPPKTSSLSPLQNIGWQGISRVRLTDPPHPEH